MGPHEPLFPSPLPLCLPLALTLSSLSGIRERDPWGGGINHEGYEVMRNEQWDRRGRGDFLYLIISDGLFFSLVLQALEGSDLPAWLASRQGTHEGRRN